MMANEIQWMHWGSSAFGKARDLNRPILLYIPARWCQWSQLMDKTTYCDRKVIAIIEEKFLPVRVDNDQRPDLNNRYNQGGWPSVVLLTPKGEAFAGCTYLAPDGFAEILSRASDTFQRDPQELVALVGQMQARYNHAPPANPDLDIASERLPQRILSKVKEDFDAKNGGFGPSMKFHHVDSLELLLYAAREFKDRQAQEMLILSLSRMAQSRLFDPVEGGFYRYSTTPDWSAPQYEKVLFDNARLCRLYLDAYSFLRDPFLRDCAFKILAYFEKFLWDSHEGVFWGCQLADADYFGLAPGERYKRKAPPADTVAYADANCAAAMALFKASVVFSEDEEKYRSMAVRTLRFIRERMLDRRAGLLFHYWRREGALAELSGLLQDQAWAVLAFTEAHQYLGDPDYRDFAGQLLDNTLQSLWVRDGAGFLDCAVEDSSLGELKTPLSPLMPNAVALEALWRLHYLKGNFNYRRWLALALKRLLPRALETVHHAAPYARILDLYQRGRLEVEVVGRKEMSKTHDFIAKLQSSFLPRKLLAFVDPEDRDFLLAHRMRTNRFPAVYVTLGREVRGPALEVAEVERLVEPF
ncbi:MAG: thioredoxin domain-containing protein [Elusimicrobia bacterium]|nr:thioredoxin domain-containing protein [Elusimicrobiota bacterium]